MTDGTTEARDLGSVRCSVTGAGIVAVALPDVALAKNYSTAGTLGMGYKRMIRFADKVYLATRPEGTELYACASQGHISGILIMSHRDTLARACVCHGV